MTPRSKKNSATLFLLYLRQISAGLLIYQPIFIPFLLSRGLNMLDVAVLQTAYNLGVLILDIPTGFFADRFGRKWALAVANSALVIGTALIAFGHTMSIFIVAELFYALAIAMDSGTHSAYLFEWLRKQNREKEYYRYDALGTFLFLGTAAAGTLVAGYFAEKDLQLPVIMTIALTSIGIPAACLLPEAPKAPSAKKHSVFLEGGSAVWALMKQVLKTPGLRWALGVTVVWFWARQYINLIISQPYFESIGLKYHLYGMLYSILTLTSGFIALFSRRLIQKPDLRGLTLVGLLLIPASFAVMGLNKSLIGLGGFFLFAIPYGLCTAITNTLLNRQFAQHGERATFLSIIDFFTRLVASVLALVLGWILARHGAASALMAATLVSGLLVVSLLPGIRKFARD